MQVSGWQVVGIKARMEDKLFKLQAFMSGNSKPAIKRYICKNGSLLISSLLARNQGIIIFLWESSLLEFQAQNYKTFKY